MRERETGRMINVNICSLHGPMNCKKDRQREQDKVIYRVDERERESERERKREKERETVKERETSRMININICSLNRPMNCKKERKNKIK